jgi:hypothetical protein
MTIIMLPIVIIKYLCKVKSFHLRTKILQSKWIKKLNPTNKIKK